MLPEIVFVLVTLTGETIVYGNVRTPPPGLSNEL